MRTDDPDAQAGRHPDPDSAATITAGPSPSAPEDASETGVEADSDTDSEAVFATEAEPETVSGTVAASPARWRRIRIRARVRVHHLALAVVTAAAAVAYAWGIDHGTLHLYYAAADRSMAHSWHDFAYGAFDARGTLSIDKLPGSLWLQALSVKVFGYHVWAMMLPGVVAGTLLVPATYRAARRVAGPRTGLAAALIVAATPAALAQARGNEADPVSVLLLVLAADAALRATANGRLRSLTAAAVWVGLAFQVKMGEAWLPVPALAAGYLAAAPGPVRRRLGHLAAAGAVLAAVSLSWMTVIAATPAADRPYADGSTDNSVFSQVFDYNGLGRVGTHSAYGLPRIAPASPASLAYAAGTAKIAKGTPPGSSPGWNRLVSGDIGHDVGWLLPAALAAAGGLAAARRRAPRTDPERAAVIVFGGWLVTDVVLFSVSQTLMPYYTAMLVPSIAVLCALGLRRLTRAAAGAAGARRWLVPAAFAAAAAWSAWLGRSGGLVGPVFAAVAAVAAALAAARIVRLPAPAAPALALAAVLAGPAAASGWLVRHGGSAWDAPYAAEVTMAHPAPALLEALRAHPAYGGTGYANADGRWEKLMTDWASVGVELEKRQQYNVYFTAAAASPAVDAGLRNVLVFGGYTGRVQDVSVDRLSAMLDAHQIAYAFLPGPLDTNAADPRIKLLKSRCTSRIAENQDDGTYMYVCE